MPKNPGTPWSGSSGVTPSRYAMDFKESGHGQPRHTAEDRGCNSLALFREARLAGDFWEVNPGVGQ